MKLNSTYAIIMMLLSSANIAMAAAPAGSTTPIPIMHHETDWQSASNNTSTISNSPNNDNATQTSTPPLSTSTNNASLNPSSTTLPASVAPNDKAPNKKDDNSDAFIRAVMKRNEILSQLQYEKQVLVLKQDILQLKVNIDKLQAENTPPQGKNTPNYGGAIRESGSSNFTSKPQLLEIFIKNDKPQATLYYRGSVTTVNIGSKLGAYTVKNISKNTVSLADNKNKSTILNILQSNPS